MKGCYRTVQEAVDEIDRLHLEIARIYQRLARILRISDVKAAIRYEKRKRKAREARHAR